MQTGSALASLRTRILDSGWFWFFVVVVSFYLVFRGPLPFVKSWWQAGQEDWDDDWNRRHRMADWMLLTGTLSGLTQAEVIEKLGEPPPTNYFREWSMVYMLGSERGFMSIDSEWLVLRVDSAGHVSDARIVRD